MNANEVMSFGFSPGDFIAVAKLAKSIYKACKNGPSEYKEICSEAKSLRFALEGLAEDANSPDSALNRKGIKRKGELDEIVANCRMTMTMLQTFVDQHSKLMSNGNNKLVRVWGSYKVGSSDLDSIRGKLTFYTSTISMFLLSLQGTTLSRIETKLDRIYARILQDDMTQARDSSASVASTASILSQIETHEDDVWAIIKSELLDEEVSMAHIMANKEEIVVYIKNLVDGKPNGSAEADGSKAIYPQIDGADDLTEEWPMDLKGMELGTIIDDQEGKVQVELSKVQYGRFRGRKACLVGLNIRCGQRWRTGPGIIAKFTVLNRSHLEDVPHEKIVDSKSGPLGAPDPSNDSDISDDSFLELSRIYWMGEELHSKGRGIWSYLLDDIQAVWLSRHTKLRLALIILHHNLPFLAKIEVSKFRKQKQRMESSSGTESAKITFRPENSSTEFDIEDLEMFVKEAAPNPDEAEPYWWLPLGATSTAVE